MKILIFGGQGLLGKSLAAHCLKEGIEYSALSRKEADISHLSSLQKAAALFKPTHIVNCAAYTAVDRAEAEPEIAFKINSVGAGYAASAAKEVGASFLHLSTDYVFEGSSSTPYTEESPCHPINVYGKSKREGELQVLDRLPEACILRTSWLFGNGGKNFISSLLDLMRAKEELKVVSDQKGRPTFYPDLASVTLKLLVSPLGSSGIFHFANEGAFSRYEIAQDIHEKAKRAGIQLACHTLHPALSSMFPTPAKRPSYSVLCTKKIENGLGIIPRNWQTALEEYLNGTR